MYPWDGSWRQRVLCIGCALVSQRALWNVCFILALVCILYDAKNRASWGVGLSACSLWSAQYGMADDFSVFFLACD